VRFTTTTRAAISRALVLCVIAGTSANATGSDPLADARRGGTTATFELVNGSSDTIARAVVTVAGSELELRDISPARREAGALDGCAEGRYDVVVEFRSGRSLTAEGGFVSAALDAHADITVTDYTISIKPVMRYETARWR
jgi:hypothetical protein